MDQKEQDKIFKVGEDMWYFRALHRNLLFALNRYVQRRSGWIVDGGSGPGGLSTSLMQLLPDALKLAIDADPLALARNPRSATYMAVGASVNALPVADNSITAYISADIIYHRSVIPEAFANETFRCLEPGGIAIVNVPAYQWLFSDHDRQVSGVRRYSKSSLKRLMEDAGFEVVYHTYWNMFLFPLLVFWRKVLPFRPPTSDLRYFPKPLEILFNAVMGLEHKILTRGGSLPFGGSLLVVARRP
ncbi:methyltransferase domain-containing protein [Gimesia sp.]|uniref:methyltransferase domain-containing protein n=1 Tax=Gimesia sp. TaxID=2024833 RepID=UPI003A93D1CF